MTLPTALIVDDEPDICELAGITLKRMSIDCEIAHDLAQARQWLQRKPFQFCITDMRLPDGDGLELVVEIQKNYPRTPVAVITAHGSMETAIQALKSGAFDFLTKPVNLAVLRGLVNNALRLACVEPGTESRLIGASPEICATRAKIAKLARSQAPVFISGESGTGKELVARMIHDQGARAGQPFIAVNCGAVPPELMESEFFGHKKGTFTGAITDKPGLFQAANGGTLFLDEVGELSLPMQVKLLRAIQEKAVRPLGTQAEVGIDVRILSATHQDLATMVHEGQFRQDLFYRINVIQLDVPPLRERGEDIYLIADFLLSRLASSAAVPKPELSLSAQNALASYAFPGNVRELENILERAMTLCEGSIIEDDVLHLPAIPASTRQAPAAALDSLLTEVEKQRILAALEQAKWNKTAAAKLLGISFRALRYRLDKLDLR